MKRRGKPPSWTARKAGAIGDIEELLDKLQILASMERLDFLTYLIELARQEARDQTVKLLSDEEAPDR